MLLLLKSSHSNLQLWLYLLIKYNLQLPLFQAVRTVVIRHLARFLTLQHWELDEN